MFDDGKNKKSIPQDDDFTEQLQGLGEKISAPKKLKEAAKSGVPLGAIGKYTAAVHVKRFTRAALAYAVCVAVLISSVFFVPPLLNNGNSQFLNNGDPTGGAPVGSPPTSPSLSGGATTTTSSTPPVATPPITSPVTPPTTDAPEPPPLPLTPPPYLSGDPERNLEKLLAGKVNLNEAGKVDMNSLRTEGFTPWAPDEDIPGLFDTYDTELEESAEKLGQCGGIIDKGGSYFYFSLTEKETVQAYVIVNARDNHIYLGRTPVDWTLYATNDKTLPLSQWTVLDDVYDGGLAQEGWLAGGYTIASERQGAYQHYCWQVSYGELINVAEFAMYAS